MATRVGSSKRLITKNLIFAIDGNDSATFPGKGSSSTTYGDLIGQNDGTLNNNATHRYHKQGILSYSGNESTSDYVTIPGSVASAISGGSFTIGIWVRLNNASTSSGGGGGTEPIIAFNNGTSARTCLSISRTGTSGTTNEQERLGMFFFGDDLVANTTKVTTIMGTKWTYVVGTFDSSSNTQTLYINGSQHSTRTSSGATNIGSTTGNIGRNDIYTRLGGSYTESDNPKLEGQTGPVHIYDRTLSAAEVLENYNVWKLRFQNSSGDGTDNGITDAGASIVTSNLVAHYDFGSPICNPGSGTTITDLQGSNNGTISGATYSKENGGCFDFNGANDYIEVSNSSEFDPGTGDFSAAVWFKCDSFSSRNILLTSGNYNSQQPGWSLHVSTDGTINVRCKAGSSAGTSQRASMRQAFSDTGWNYLTMVIDRTNDLIIGYLNASTSGFAVGGGPNNQDLSGFSDGIASNENLRIGDVDPSSNNYSINGKIASCEIYQGKALTAAEVLQNYNATKSRFGL